MPLQGNSEGEGKRQGGHAARPYRVSPDVGVSPRAGMQPAPTG